MEEDEIVEVDTDEEEIIQPESPPDSSPLKEILSPSKKKRKM